jgi:hypothetical protein
VKLTGVERSCAGFALTAVVNREIKVTRTTIIVVTRRNLGFNIAFSSKIYDAEFAFQRFFTAELFSSNSVSVH